MIGEIGEIREKIIECYYYLSQAMIAGDTAEVGRIKEEINDHLESYLKIMKTRCTT